MPALLSLVCAPGQRPRAEDVLRLAERERNFTISHRPAADEGWVELLINGLTYDLWGLAPAPPSPPPPVRHRYGLPPSNEATGEAILLAPGPHLGAGRAMPPVIRGAAELAATLTGLAGARSVCWHSAGTMVSAELFTRSVRCWLRGEAFPALGLTAIFPCADEAAMCSEGLSLFTGQELRLERGTGAPAEDAKLALRLIDWLVANGRLQQPVSLDFGPAEAIRVEPRGDVVRAWRQTR